MPPKEEPLITNEEWADVLKSEGSETNASDTAKVPAPPTPVYNPEDTNVPPLLDNDEMNGNSTATETPALVRLPKREQRSNAVNDRNLDMNEQDGLQYPVLDGADIDLESMAPEAVSAWVRKYPEQAWRKAYETAAYMIATGQVQLPQGNAPESTPEPGAEIPATPEEAWESPEAYKDWDSIQKSTEPSETLPSEKTDEQKQPVKIDYVVKSGDTLTRIALDNNVTIKEIMNINSIEDENAIFAGQELVVPQRLGENAIIPDVISDEGVEFIKSEETINDKFEPYLYDDLGKGKGNCTIGYGYKVHTGPCDGRKEELPFINGINEEQATNLLNESINEAENIIHLYVNKPLTQSQYDALVSYIYNVGAGGFIEDLVEAINKEDINKIEKIMKENINVETVNNNGEIEIVPNSALIRRRELEFEMFRGGFE